MTGHATLQTLEQAVDFIRQSPRDSGRIEMIVHRPAEDARAAVSTGQLDIETGLVGDNWKIRGSKKSADGSAIPEAQITLMNSRFISVIAQEKDRWQLAGDQLYVDLDLSEENLPPGTRLSLGSALLEITAKPHTGCAKFSGRFGADALKFASTKEGLAMRLRGVYAMVIQAGTIQVGDEIRKV